MNFLDDDGDDDFAPPPPQQQQAGDVQHGDGGGGGHAAGAHGGQEEAPEWACAYCGLAEPACVVKCNTTKRWFCNGRAGGVSHIIFHLAKSRYKEVSLHPDSPLENATLECYNCGSKNVFLLGFIPAREESVVVLLCREPCLHSNQLEDLDWDVSQWMPLVEDRRFLTWLVKDPSEAEGARVPNVTRAEMQEMEDAWKRGSGPEAVVEQDVEVEPVQFYYEDGTHYQSVLGPLVQLECDEDQKRKEQNAQTGVQVRWDAAGDRRVAHFDFMRDESLLKLLPGDELTLRHEGDSFVSGFSGTGQVVRIANNATNGEEVSVEMKDRGVPTQLTTGWTVEVAWRPTTFSRMQAALRAFARDETSISAYLYHRLLGHAVETPRVEGNLPKRYSVPGLPELNHSQVSAVKSVLQRPLSLIQGPPGTGKTVTSATIVYHLVRMSNGQVLACAPSNVAVDHLTEKIQKAGLKVVRLCAKSREGVSSSVDHLTLHQQTAEIEAGAPEGSDHSRLLRKQRAEGRLDPKEEAKLISMRRRVESQILEAADVICTTTVNAGDRRIAHLQFKQVLVDESTQAAEPECLIPLVLGAKQVVLVGDHCQLGPIVLCKKAAKAGLARSLFERLVMLGIRPVRLQVQYRMHPCLSEFPSNTFYEGTLQNGVTQLDRVKNIEFPWPDPSRPMFFYNSIGQEELSASGTSFLNRTEAAMVEKVVTALLKANVTPDKIGVITPYDGQRSYVINYMARNGSLRQELYAALEVASVDAFQGREKEFVILSCVRSNDYQGIGFLNDPRRLNVALTRARCGLVVIGNAKVLSKQLLWNNLLVHFKDQQLVVEGPLNSLKQSMVSLSKPRKFVTKSLDFGIAGPLLNTQFSSQAQAPPMYAADYASRGAGAGAAGASGGRGLQHQPPSAAFGYQPGMAPADQMRAYREHALPDAQAGGYLGHSQTQDGPISQEPLSGTQSQSQAY